MGLCLILGLIAFTAGAIYYGNRAAKYDLAKLETMRERTLVFDRAGEQLGHVYGHGENRLVIKLDDVSEHFIQALLAREDSRFYGHGGVDWIGVVRAAIRNVKEGEVVQGASTLTMQLARNSFGIREKSFDRKFLEVAIAKRIERNFTKDEILEYYMNRIYFGSGLYGIERASQGFFMKPAKDLNLSESAMLAGIIRGPSRFSPFRDLEAAEAQRDEVLERMISLKMVTREQAAQSKLDKVALRPVDQRIASPDYVIQAIHNELELLLDEKKIDDGGLKVYTTLDAGLQRRASEALEQHLSEVEHQSGFRHPSIEASPTGESRTETEYLQGALVAIDNQTGGLLAMVGGRDFDDSPFNRALYARRQVGSTFKPFVYATAFTNGLLPGTLVSDGPISMPGGNGRTWRPSNSDGKFGGPTPAAVGLIRSRNTMSIRVGQSAGIDNVLGLANELNFGEQIPRSPVTYLGAFETTPLTLTSAYSIFPNRGERKRPYLIQRIDSAQGDTLFESTEVTHTVLSESTAWVTSEILGQVMDQGTGVKARSLGFEQSAYGKTGTTNDYRDAWFVGFTDKVTCGVWVGLDRPQTIMNRGYGSTLALPIWAEVMKHAQENGYPASRLPAPPNLVSVQLCRECGLQANRKAVDPYPANLPAGLVPSSACRGHGLFAGGKKKSDKQEGGFFKRIGRLFSKD